MITCEHIIGLTAIETARQDAATASSVAARFAAIRREGHLRPRGRHKSDWHSDTGSTFGLDILAGDGEYVFLSIGSRYRDLRQPEHCYGFVFDAEQLIRRGALCGPDMMDAYEDLAHEIASELDAEMPPLPMISDSEVWDFMGSMGESDPAMAAYIQQQSTSRYHDLISAMTTGNGAATEGGEEAIRRFSQRVGHLQARHRQPQIRNGCSEILVRDSLALSLAVGEIVGGQIVSRGGGR